MEEDNEPVIIDIGSGHLKAGFASDDAPKSLIPMVIGRPVNKALLVGMEAKDSYIGHEVKDKRGVLNVSNPVVGGVIKSTEAV